MTAAQRFVRAEPEAVYDLVADVSRMGEWSPECYRCEWVGSTTGPEVGARFRGWNRFKGLRWSRLCEVVTADRGREFSFRTVPTGVFRDVTVWTFRLVPQEDGTLVEELYALQKQTWPFKLSDRFSGHPTALERGMEETLARIARAAEAAR